MKILMLNKFHYLKGGSERYYFELTRLLEEHGHTVIPFSMKDDKNEPCEYADFFVPNVDYAGEMSVLQSMRAAVRTIYYPLARRKMGEIIAHTKPDIIHIHNIYHQLTYSPLFAAKEAGLPVVMTAHDYKLVCPRNSLFCTEGDICEKCGGFSFQHSFRRRCGKGEMAQSFILMLESYMNRRIFNAIDRIDLIITPSCFMRKKLLEYGIPSRKVIHQFNSLDLSAYTPRYGGDGYALFLGRLSHEKGLATLLQAMQQVSDVPLKIMGEGPENENLLQFVRGNSMKHVEFLGYKSGAELTNIIRNASFVIVPSEWYENLPYSILEAFALGKPVVASRIGGIPELVQSGVNGYLFTPGNADELAQRIRDLASNELMLREFGRNGRSLVQRECAPDKHYDIIMEHYERLIVKKRKQAESSSNSTT